MRPVLQCLLLAALSLGSASAQAAPMQLVSAPLPVDETSELLVGVVNTCTSSADVRVTVLNGITGEVLRRSRVTIAAKRGAALPYSWGVSQGGTMAVTSVAVACLSAVGQSRPLVSFTVRDRVTKVPRYAGDSTEGTGI